MTFRTIVRGAIRRSLAFITGFALVLGGAPALFAQDSTAAIAGVILDPAGQPASGFKVTVRDVASNTQFTSGPTDAAGNYSVNVPVGGRYKVDSVVAADGVTKLAVQDVAPVSVLAAGTTRLNVAFTNTPAATTQTAATTPTEDDKKKQGEVPWYKKPGAIVGLVLGSVAVAAIALSAGGGGDDNNEASPYTPPAP